MNTLLSINNYHYRRGGAETIYLEQNRLFEESGWTVVPFAMQHPSNLSSPWSRYFVSEIEWGRSYGRAQIVTKAAKSVYSWEARRQLRALLRVVQPDVCHAHNVYHHLSPAIFSVLRGAGIRTVLTLHDLKLACPAYTMYQNGRVCERCRDGRLSQVVANRCVKNSLALSSLVFVESALHRFIGSYERNIDMFIVPSRFYRSKLIEWGWPADRFVHVPNFVDATQLQISRPPGDEFAYFGRLSAEKGLATLIRAAAAAGVKLSIIGTGPQEVELRALAAREKAEVNFRGYLSGRDLQRAISEARATVLPSEWYENAPMGVMESYALSRPVIGAAIGGIPELIREGETGLTFESGSVSGLAQALSEMAALPLAEVANMGRCGRAWMEADYAPERYRERVMAVYRGLGAPMAVDELGVAPE